MPIPKALLPHATRAVANLHPRDSNSDLNDASDVGSILGGVFGGLAVLVAVMFGVWQIMRWNKEDQRLQEAARRRHNKWYKVVGRKLRP